MRSRHLPLGFALLALAGGSACAVNRPAASAPRCSVEGAERLPSASGGAEALCAEIEAATAGLPATAISVRVVSASALAASVTVDGRTLPEIKMARSDGTLDRRAFKRFAEAIAASARPAVGN
jgi:hypothetical protein